MLRLSDFPNYETYTDINHAYSDFISKLTQGRIQRYARYARAY